MRSSFKLQKVIVVLFGFFVLGSCKQETPISQTSDDSQRIEDFLTEAVDVMEENSINRLNIDWIDFRAQVFAEVDDGPFLIEVEKALRKALSLLGDNHSLVRMPNGDFLSESQIRCSGFSGSAQNLPDDIGYVRVRGFGGNASQARVYIQDFRDQIRLQDNASLKGWIVDNRGNGGGNMYPMIAGIGELIGDGLLGYFVDPLGRANAWGYADHSSLFNERAISTAEDRYELINDSPKVAVLLDNGVASSGEIVAISFVGRENTRSFGSATCGLSTANSSFALSNGISLILTVSTMADREFTVYGQEVVPDENVSSEAVVDRAIEWLRED